MASEDEELSRDVNTLGRLLGEVLREQEGEAGFALVEELRARTKALRAQEPDPPGVRARRRRPCSRAAPSSAPRTCACWCAPSRCTSTW
jgi:hypothetical protein